MELDGLTFSVKARVTDTVGVLQQLRNRVRRIVNTELDRSLITLSPTAEQEASRYTHFYNYIGDRVRDSARAYLHTMDSTKDRPATFIRRYMYQNYGIAIKHDKFWSEVGAIMFRAATDRVYKGKIEPFDIEKGPRYYLNEMSCWWDGYYDDRYAQIYKGAGGYAAMLWQEGTEYPVGRAWVLPGTKGKSVWVFNHYGVGTLETVTRMIVRALNVETKDVSYVQISSDDGYDDDNTFTDFGIGDMPAELLDELYVNDGEVWYATW